MRKKIKLYYYTLIIIIVLFVSCSNVNSNQLDSSNYTWLVEQSFHYLLPNFLPNTNLQSVTQNTYQYLYYNSKKDYKSICQSQSNNNGTITKEKNICTSTIISNDEYQFKSEYYKLVGSEWIKKYEITIIYDTNSGIEKIVNVKNFQDISIPFYIINVKLFGDVPANSEITKYYTVDLINYENSVFLYKQTDRYDSSSNMFYEIKDSVHQKIYTKYSNGRIKKEWVIESANNDFLKTIFNNGYGLRYSYEKVYDEEGNVISGGSNDFLLENVNHDNTQLNVLYILGGIKWGFTYRKVQIPF